MSRKFTFLKSQTRLLLNPSGEKKNIEQRMGVHLTGFAGSAVSGVEVRVSTTNAHRGNDATRFGAALILVTDWMLWEQGVS